MVGKRRILEQREARRLIGYYQRGLFNTLDMTAAIIRSFERGLLAANEAEWMLENLKQLKKLRLFCE